LQPKTDYIAFFTATQEHRGLVPLERVQATIGHLFEPLDHYPPRWFVKNFRRRFSSPRWSRKTG
jgi:hypothetical protein